MTDADSRIFVLALCGGADRPIAELGGGTPFTAAHTPNLDALARRGLNGLLTVIAEDVPPESDSGAMSLLGYDPLRYYTGRGPLEGLGIGFLEPGDGSVAFRVNFGSWDPITGRLDRRTSRDLEDDELSQLVQEIVDEVRLDDVGVGFRLTGFGRHRGILALSPRGPALDGRVGNTDPGFVSRGAFGVPVADPGGTPQPCLPLVLGTAAAQTAAAVNAFVERSAAVLDASTVNRARRAAGRRPANIVLVRDGGDALPELPAFSGRTGMSLSMYGQIPAERGLARLIGAQFHTSRADSGQTDLAYYADLVSRLLADRSGVVFVHVKGPDEPGHDNRPHEKTEAVADIDSGLIGPLVRGLRPADSVVVTCDHATPCELQIHAPDRVPAVVAGPRVRADVVDVFSESDAAAGQLAPGRACELLPWLTGLPE